MNRLFVIVVTYKGKQWYDRCFTSLRESSIPITTIVVDNASNDGTVEYIKEHFPEIILIESKENLGFGRANNIAMRYALDHDCDYVFLLNQDAWLEPDALEIMIDSHKKNETYGILSPMHLTPDKNHLEKGFANIIKDNRNSDDNFLQDLFFCDVKSIYETKYVHAAGWLLPKNTLELVGGFSPIFFYTGEDDDYMNRVLYHKLKIGFCPGARMVHDCVHERHLPKNYQRFMHLKNILIELTNININQTVIKYQILLSKRAIKSLIKVHLSLFHYYLNDIKFCQRMKKTIIQTRLLNMKTGRTWLS